MKTPASIDEYISRFPREIQTALRQIRRTIHDAVPGAGEKISYGIPTITLEGKYFIYFAAFKKHLSIYPVPGGVKEFDKAFAKYNTTGRGTLQLPLDEPLPLKLITRIAKYLAKQKRTKEKTKKAAKAKNR